MAPPDRSGQPPCHRTMQFPFRAVAWFFLLNSQSEDHQYTKTAPGLRLTTRVNARGNPPSGLRPSYPRHVYSDLVDAGTRRDIERLLVGVAKADIGRLLGSPDGAEMFALRRDDPHAAGSGFVKIALGVDAQAIGDTALGVAAHVDEQFAVGKRAVGTHLIAVDVIFAAGIDVEIFLVRREGETIDGRHVVDDLRHLAVLPAVNPHDSHFAAGIVFALPEGAERVGEIDAAVALDHDIVGSAEAFALEFIRQHGACAIVFNPHNRTPRKGRDHDAALAVNRQTVGAQHGKFFKLRIAFVHAVILESTPAPGFRPRITDLARENRRIAFGRELPDHVAWNISKQQITLAALLHPNRAFGEAEAALDEFDFGVCRHQSVERRIEPHDVTGLSRRQRARQQAHNCSDLHSGHIVLPVSMPAPHTVRHDWEQTFQAGQRLTLWICKLQYLCVRRGIPRSPHEPDRVLHASWRHAGSAAPDIAPHHARKRADVGRSSGLQPLNLTPTRSASTNRNRPMPLVGGA